MGTCWSRCVVAVPASAATLPDVTQSGPDEYPGAALGLPERGTGSLAGWRARIAALILDWAASMVVAVFLFGDLVLHAGGWHAWMILAVFVVESAVLTALASGSFGQLIAGIGVVRLDGRPLGWTRALARAVMIALVLPTVVIGAERRALNDLLLGTVVVQRRAGRIIPLA